MVLDFQACVVARKHERALAALALRCQFRDQLAKRLGRFERQHLHAIFPKADRRRKERMGEFHKNTVLSSLSTISECALPTTNSMRAYCFSVTTSICTSPSDGLCCRMFLMIAPATD